MRMIIHPALLFFYHIQALLVSTTQGYTHSVIESCTTKTTPWQETSHGGIHTLQRLPLYCGDPLSSHPNPISMFHMETRGERIRYEYSCCKLTNWQSCVKLKTRGITVNNWQPVAKRKECPGSEYCQDRGSGWTTFAKCVKICKPRASMFIFGTNEFGVKKCHPDGRCACCCETASTNGECDTDMVTHDGFELYRFRGSGRADCFEQGVRYLGNYINGNSNDEHYYNGAGRRDSAQECQLLCSQVAQCANFVYHTSPGEYNRACLLFSTRTGQKFLAGRVSGSKHSKDCAGDDIHQLWRHKVECPNNGYISMLSLERKGTTSVKIQYNYWCVWESARTRKGTTCYDDATDWAPALGGDVAALKSHTVKCRPCHALNKFQLVQDGGGANIRYTYTCCKPATAPAPKPPRCGGFQRVRGGVCREYKQVKIEDFYPCRGIVECNKRCGDNPMCDGFVIDKAHSRCFLARAGCIKQGPASDKFDFYQRQPACA